MSTSMEDRLAAIFRAVFELPADADVRRLRQVSTSAWDSLAHVMLIGALESEFGLSVDPADSLDLTSYDAVALFVEEHVA